MTPADFRAYISKLRDSLSRGDATEHTHRPALQSLLETTNGIAATNEPKRIACGAPDFAVTKAVSNPLTIGYIEAKNIGTLLIQLNRIATERSLLLTMASS